MYCYKCGKEMQDDMLFCPYCGTQSVNSVENKQKTKTNKEHTVKTHKNNDSKDKIFTFKDAEQRISRGFKIAGGVIEIVAGVFWLIVSLLINKIGNILFGLNLEIIQIIMPILFIYFGIMACTNRPHKNDFVTFGILNMMFIGLQYYYGTYVGLGIVQMVLLFVAGMLFFFVKPTKQEIEYKKELKEYIKNEPPKNKLMKKMLIILASCIAGIVTIFIILSSINIKFGDGYLSFDGFGSAIVGLIMYSFVLIYFIVCDFKLKEYKLTSNIIWTSIAIFALVFIDAFFVSQSFNDGIKTSNGLFVSIIALAVYVLLILATNQSQYNIEYRKIYCNKNVKEN